MFANIIISVGVSIPAFLSDVSIITQVAAKVKSVGRCLLLLWDSGK